MRSQEKTLFTVRVAKHWGRLPREPLERVLGPQLVEVKPLLCFYLSLPKFRATT